MNDDVLAFLHERFPLIDNVRECGVAPGARCAWGALDGGRGQFVHLIATRTCVGADASDRDGAGVTATDARGTTPPSQAIAADDAERWDLLVARVEFEPCRAVGAGGDQRVDAGPVPTTSDVVARAGDCACCAASAKRVLVLEDGGGFVLRQVKLVL